MTEMQERFDQWLRDAHAMEEQAEQMLKAQATRIENYPELKARIEEHLSETQAQREKLERCLEGRGTSSSSMKDFSAQFSALMQGAGGAMAGDEVVKGVMASYTFEHMEIAAYRILIATARTVGDTRTAAVCEEILREEEAMAAWLAEHMPQVAETFLTREEHDLEGAKR